jgi:hypothetical protein
VNPDGAVTPREPEASERDDADAERDEGPETGDDVVDAAALEKLGEALPARARASASSASKPVGVRKRRSSPLALTDLISQASRQPSCARCDRAKPVML